MMALLTGQYSIYNSGEGTEAHAYGLVLRAYKEIKSMREG